jgi:hypothetical protein
MTRTKPSTSSEEHPIVGYLPDGSPHYGWVGGDPILAFEDGLPVVGYIDGTAIVRSGGRGPSQVRENPYPHERTSSDTPPPMMHDRPPPVSWKKEYVVLSKVTGSMFGPRSNMYIAHSKREAMEIAQLRSEDRDRNLPIFELPPTLDPVPFLSTARDGVYVCHQLRKEFGPVCRDVKTICSVYSDEELDLIAQRGPPEP